MKAFLKLSFIFFVSLFVFVSCQEEKIEKPVNRLVAQAGDDQTTLVNTTIELDGRSSYDANNKAFSYNWKIKTKPSGSGATLAATQAVAEFVPDKAGVFVITLTLIQGSFAASDDVVVTVTGNNEPNEPTAVYLNENISMNTTFEDIFEDPSKADYIVETSIQVRADLVIAPGVVIAFQKDRGLEIVSGSFIARGTTDEPIVFKGVVNQPAYWLGLLVHSNSELNELAYASVENGGSAIFTSSMTTANIAVSGTDYSGGVLAISNTLVSGSGGYGVYVQGMGALTRFSDNTFSDNASAAAHIPANSLNVIDPSGHEGLAEVEISGPVKGPDVHTWKKLEGGTYVVRRDIFILTGVNIEPGASFRIDPGVQINVGGEGFLNATGTDAEKITFSGNGTGVYWNGIFVNTNSDKNVIKYVEISQGGQNRIGDAAQEGNIVLGHYGVLEIENSIVRDGLGYGLVAERIGQVNQDITLTNSFSNCQKGHVYPHGLAYPDLPSLTGVWLDQWSFNEGFLSVDADYFDRDSGTWFAGAERPWDVNDGIGIRFADDGTFTWAIAEHSPMTGCESWSAEFIIGNATFNSEIINMDQTYWRSKFVNSCDPSWNVDMDVAPQQLQFPYEIDKVSNLWNGEEYWRLTFFNPDGSSFSYYRK